MTFRFLPPLFLGVLSLLALAGCDEPKKPAETPATSFSWNAGWRFLRADAPADADDAAWETVELPHTPLVEAPEKMSRHFQGLCSYRRHFAADPTWRGKKVMVRFDGAMQVADVWLNGTKLATHEGGYLPFAVNLTPHLRFNGDNVLSVRLDNSDHPHVPPGKPLASLDFTYAGGLYRGVTLEVADPIHISSEFESENDGGVFIRTESADAARATMFARADVRNDGDAKGRLAVRFTLSDSQGRAVASETCDEREVTPGTHAEYTSKLRVEKPALWHPDRPVLYTLHTELLSSGSTHESRRTRCGIRTVVADPLRGLVLNGEPLLVRGANFHQDCPWLGNAVPVGAQWRDIRRLKNAGFNFLRLAHYPHSQATMDACDELGILTMVCTPGWQWYDNTPKFEGLARRNIRDMIRWHRNHPSVAVWEVSLNETYGRDDFHRECCAIARSEYPGAICGGDSYGSKNVEHYDIPYCGWPGNGYNRPAAPGFEKRKTSFIREYGDNDTGIGNRVARGDGEETMLRQAWTYQWTHNTNNGWGWHIGDAQWASMDAARGGSPNATVGRWGVIDFERVPKFSYHFYRSQQSPKAATELFIPHWWDDRPSPTRVVVFSNCDEVELRQNGKTVARQKPDSGPDSPLGDADAEELMLVNYMKTGKTIHDFEAMIEQRRKQPRKYPLFTGGNCVHLDHPPFTFPLTPYEPGTLEAIGYLNGREIARFVRRTPGAPAALRMSVDTLGRAPSAGKVDAVFVRAEITDADGEVIPANGAKVRFQISGPATMLNPEEMTAEMGVASALIRTTGASGEIRITATSEGLKGGATAVSAESR